MKVWSRERKAASLFLVCLLGLAGLRFYSHYNTFRLIDSGRWEDHAEAIRLHVRSLLAAVEAARSAQRDFLIRRDGQSSAAYADARRSVGQRLDELRQEAATRSDQADDVERLRGLVDAELEALDRGVATAPAPVLSPPDAEIIAGIREAAARLDAEETRFVNGHVAAARDRARRQFWVSGISTGLTVGLLGFGYWLLLRHFAARRDARAQIESLNGSLRRNVEELESLFDVLPVGVVICDDPGCGAMRGNAQMASLLGVAPGRNLSLSAPPGERPGYRVFRDGRQLRPDELPMQVAAARGEALTNVELEVVRGDESIRLCGNVVPLRDESGRTRGSVGAFWDASAFEAREERLIEERDAAEAAAAATEDLVATVSHDLRTPLHAVRLLATTLRREPAGREDARETVEQILRLCDAQARLISDVLDLTRISHGRLAVEKRPVRLADVVGAACETVRLVAEAGGVRLSVSADDHDAVVRGDAARLQQVFWNLLSNALKFTGPGGRVDITVRRVDGSAEVRVADTGSGIDPQDLPHIFDRFWKGKRPGRLNRSGLGLGLAIARHVVELHDGTISADSEGKGKGSTFTVRLPLVDARPDEPETQAVSLGAHALARDSFGGTSVEESPSKDEPEAAPTAPGA